MNRNLPLDILRAIAIFLVIGRHMSVCPEETHRLLHHITTIWRQGGWIGVDLFFVLSGFLVSGLLFREHYQYQTLDIQRFLIRRGLKLYPAFWVLLLTTLIVKGWILQFPIPFKGFLGELTFTQNYLGGLWYHTWSLAVEEHFYILLCLLLPFLLRCQRSPQRHPFYQIPKLFAGIAIVCLLLRIITAIHYPSYSHQTHLFGTHIRIDSLMFGVLLAWGWHYHDLQKYTQLRSQRLILVSAGILCFIPAFLFNLETTWWIPVFGFVLLYLGSGALLLGVLQSKTLSRPLATSFASLGSYSYSIYLWHMPVNGWGSTLLHRTLGENFNWYWYVSFYVIGSLLFGILIAKLIEYPVLHLRDRFYPSRSSSLQV